MDAYGEINPIIVSIAYSKLSMDRIATSLRVGIQLKLQCASKDLLSMWCHKRARGVDNWTAKDLHPVAATQLLQSHSAPTFFPYQGERIACLCLQPESLLLFRISADGVDIVLDCLCGENTGKGLSLLKPLGTYILYGEWEDGWPVSDNGWRQSSVYGSL